MRENNSIFQNIDWVSILLFFTLVFMGWGNIYAAVFNAENSSILDLSQRYGKQLMWIGTTVVLAILILIIDGSLYNTLAYPIYGLTMLALVAVLFFGKEISGARSWFVVGGFSVQPAEFAKFATALAIARFLGKKPVDFTKIGNQLAAFFIVFLPAVLIVPQPDPGSALVYASFVLVLYREGLPGSYIFIGFSLAILFILSLLVSPLYLTLILAGIALIVWFLTRHVKNMIWRVVIIFSLCAGFIQTVDYSFNNLLEDRHRNRINILLGKADDPQGIGYNTNQSMIAIGSGGFSGKGYLQGTQTKYDFVPEQSTDFIFCTVGEEWGFLGSTLLVLLFTIFFFRLVFLAERQKSTFARVYGYSVAAILFFHFTINIAMTIGLAPVIGIPLPFFSYGGSSLWGFTILLFIFLKLDAYRWQML
jgi:rod shape determining protein RodA